MVTRTLLCASLVSLAACDQATLSTMSFSGATMGTSYEVTVERRGTAGDTVAVGALVEIELARLVRILSTYDPDSDVSRFGRFEGTGPVAVDAGVLEVLEKALEVSRRSGGAFDPTVAPLVDAWGFGPVDVTPPDSAAVVDLWQRVGFEQLTLDVPALTLAKGNPRTRIDLSGIAKGYAAQRIADALRASGYESALVDVGGEISALRHPLQ
jgi:thiamine biosynthesis lipoprotein